MVRKSDDAYSPEVIDFYYYDRIEDVWEGVHACVWIDGEGGAFRSVCEQVQTDTSNLEDEAIYDSLDDLAACDGPPCAICEDSGAFGTSQ